jgi:glycosyltransferase involved in cell wall biosynthesis
MKILIIIDSIGTGGAQKLKAELAQGLAQLNNNVEIFIYNENNDGYFEKGLEKLGIKIHRSSKKRQGFSLNILMSLRRILRLNNFDAVISSMHTPSIYAMLAMVGIKNFKFIVCDESSSIANVSFLKKNLFYLSTIVSDFVVPNSFNEAKLMKMLPGRANKIFPIWNGYDISKNKFRSDLDKIGTTKKELLVVGRVAYPKNGLNLLKGLSIFMERNGWIPKVTWVGRDDYDSKSKYMKKEMNLFLSENPKIQSMWDWAGTVDSVERYYKSSDALIHVSIYEGLPNVICEAMLLGCFVIASNVCDHPLVIGNNKRGLLCDPFSPSSICNSIEQFYFMDESERFNIIKDARKFAEIEFDKNSMTNKYLSLLNE